MATGTQAPREGSDGAPDISRGDSTSTWSILWKAPLRAIEGTLKLPMNAWNYLFHDVPLVRHAKWLLHPATLLAIAGGLAAGYHNDWFRRLNFSLPGAGPVPGFPSTEVSPTAVPLGDWLDSGGRTVSLGAQNFYNWGRTYLPANMGGLESMQGGTTRSGTLMEPWQLGSPPGD